MLIGMIIVKMSDHWKRMGVVSGLAVVGSCVWVYWEEAREDQSWSSQVPTPGLCGEWCSVAVY